MSRTQSTAIGSALLVIAAAIGFLIYDRGPAVPEEKNERSQNGNGSSDSVAAGPGDEKGRAAIPSPGKTQPSRKNPGSADYWKDDEVTKAAKAVLVPALEKIEWKNARALFSRKFGATEISGIAISAPTAEDIGMISMAMTAALEKAPPERKAEIQEKLQALYNRYTSFKGAYQVVYASRSENGKMMVTVNEMKDLENVMPAEDGTLNLPTLGSATFTSEEAWRTRYGHLLGDPDPKEPK